MAFPRIGGQGIPLNLGNSISNAITLPAGQLYNIPSGTYALARGQYTSLQWKDPVLGQYRTINATSGFGPHFIDSDGGNFRLANLTGCPVGALITNAGSSLTNGVGTVTITPSSGGSVWQSVVGGALSLSITTSGASYTYPPTIIIPPPTVVGGVQATAHVASISGGVIQTITLDNAGAGYPTAPPVTIVNDARDTTGNGGVITATLDASSSGLLTAMYPTDPGNPLTDVPTFTFSPASSIAATAVMNFVVTSFAIGTSGSSYGTATSFLILSQGGIVAGTRATHTAGPIDDTGLTQPRMAQIAAVAGSASGGTLISAGQVVVDAGFGFQAVPNMVVIPSSLTAPQIAATATAVVGGITDTSFLQPI